MRTAVLLALSGVLALGAASGEDVEPPHAEHHGAVEPLGRPGPDWQDEGEGPFAVGEGRGMMCPCPMCHMARGRRPGRMMEMRMREAGVPDETVTRGRMLMRARIHPADPQGLLALEGELNLTREQADELRDIIEDAREQALDVLTDEQWERLRKLRPRAESVMEMHRTFMPHMREMRQREMMPEREPARRERQPMRERMMRRRPAPEREGPFEE